MAKTRATPMVGAVAGAAAGATTAVAAAASVSVARARAPHGSRAVSHPITAMGLPRYPQVDASVIRQRLRDTLGRMGFDWALAKLVDVHVTYTAESGMGCSLIVVAIACSAYYCQCVSNKFLLLSV